MAAPASPSAPARPGGRLANLDGLRALAVAAVVLHHVPHLPDGPLRVIQDNARHGVSLFFALSGYLITTLLLRERERQGAIDLAGFYRRRTLRLMPLYYGTLAVYAILVLGLGLYSPESRALFSDKLPAFALYYSNLVPRSTEGPFFFAWSLASEEQFYALAGVGFACLAPRAMLGLSLAAVAAKVALASALPPASLDALPLRALMSLQEPIALGVALAVAASSRGGEPVRRLLAHRASVPLSALVALVLLVASPLTDRTGPRCELLYLSLTVLVGACAARPPLGLLEHPRLAEAGRASYATYLVHMLVIEASNRLSHRSPLAALAASVLVTVPISLFVHRTIELPLQRWGQKRFAAPALGRAAASRLVR